MAARFLRFACGLVLTGAAGLAQPGFISTVVGDVPDGDGGPAIRAPLFGPSFGGYDRSGNLVFLDGPLRVRRVNPEGRIETAIGNGASHFWTARRSVVAERAAASPIESTAVFQAPDGTIYFSHEDLACPTNSASQNSGLQRTYLFSLSPAGEVTQLAGGNCGNFVDRTVPNNQAVLAPIGAIAADAAGRVFLVEPSRNRILKVENGTVGLFAGNNAAGFSGDGGPAAQAQLRNPGDIAALPDGTVAIADRGNNRIRIVRADGTIATLVQQAGLRDLALDAAGQLHASNGNIVWKVASNGTLTVVRTVPHLDFTIDPDGSVVTVNQFQIFRQEPGGGRTLLAGLPPDTAPTRISRFARTLVPFRIQASPSGEVLFSDSFGLRRLRADGTLEPPIPNIPPFAIFTIDSEGSIYRLTARGIEKLTLDGQETVAVTRAELGDRQPYGLLVVGKRIYFTDLTKHQVFAAGEAGKVALFAGDGRAGQGGDGGPATAAQLQIPLSLGADSAGSIYVGSAVALRKIDAAGRISTVTRSTAPCRTFTPQRGMLATEACLYSSIMTVDPEGNVYGVSQYGSLADFGTTRAEVYRISAATGRIETLASGDSIEQGDGGPAREAGHTALRAIALGGGGSLFLGSQNRVRKIAGVSPFAAAPEAILLTAALRGAPVTDVLRVASGDTETRAYRASIAYNGRAGGWLTVSPASGAVTAEQPVVLELKANPGGLAKGTYFARIAVEDPATGQKLDIPVTLLVSGTEQQLRLSRTGMTFQAVAGGPAVVEQRLSVLNTGRGNLDWTAAASTLTGGNWLTVAPTSGRSVGGQAAPEAAVRVNPAGLEPGLYYGLVTVSSADADNAPQSAIVLLSVLAAGQRPGSVAYPAGVIFSGAPGATLAPQAVDLGNPNAAASTYTINTVFPTALRWLTVTPLTGSISAGQTGRIQLQASTQGAAAGVYRAAVNVTFAPENVTRTIDVVMVLSAAPRAAPGTAANVQRTADGCTPRNVIPVFRAPGGGFAVTAGWPQAVEMQVIDDCLDPVSRGRITVSFSSGDQPVSLTPVGDGRWSGTWAPQTQRTSGLRLSAAVEAFELGLNGAAAIEGGVRNNPDQPVIEAGGILNGASFSRGAPVAVGSAVTVRGSRLSTTTQRAPSFPLPARLGDTVVQIGGFSLPLRVAMDGRVDAMLPYGIADSTIHQAFVRRGNTYSLPEPVVVSAAQPAVYSRSGTGKGQGEVFVVTEDGSVLADAARPARQGDEILIYATGLGRVDPAVRDGVAAPEGTTVVDTVTVFIQGKEAEVKSAGLVAGEVGRYVVRAVVPAVTQDGSASLVVQVGDQAVSPVVTIATTDQ